MKLTLIGRTSRRPVIANLVFLAATASFIESPSGADRRIPAGTRSLRQHAARKGADAVVDSRRGFFILEFPKFGIFEKGIIGMQCTDLEADRAFAEALLHGVFF